MPDPTPNQRADYMVRKLENLIRDGKSERGMSFKTWQALARTELTNNFAELERRHIRTKHDLTNKRLILVAASAIVTIGFWGTMVTVDKTYGDISALVMFVAGAVLLLVGLEIGLHRLVRAFKAENRERLFIRIEDFDKQLKRLEALSWRRLQAAKEKEKADAG